METVPDLFRRLSPFLEKTKKPAICELGKRQSEKKKISPLFLMKKWPSLQAVFPPPTTTLPKY